jgi:hypothetical protein
MLRARKFMTPAYTSLHSLIFVDKRAHSCRQELTVVDKSSQFLNLPERKPIFLLMTMNTNMQSTQQQQMPQQHHQDFQQQMNNDIFNCMPQMQRQEQMAAPRFNAMGSDSVMPGHSHQGNNNMMPSKFNFQPLGMNSNMPGSAVQDEKRKLEIDDDDVNKPLQKKMKVAGDSIQPPPLNLELKLTDDDNDSTAPAPVSASKEGMSYFADNDVLSGRGGGTNVHPGNRNFRDLINLHRRAYLKARKNDKPAISRAIVRAIRETTGKFLKKDDNSGLWFEIGDDAAREKTSQALRQRAPEMRKLLFDTEREEARVAADEHLRQQRVFMGDMGNPNMMGNNMIGNNMGNQNMMNNSGNNMNGMNDNSMNGMMNPALLQAMVANQKQNLSGSNNPEFSQIFSAALLQNGINRYTNNTA